MRIVRRPACALDYTAGTEIRAKVQSFTAETHQMFGMVIRASHTQETAIQPSVFEEIIELALYVIQQRAALGGQRFRKAGIALSNEYVLFVLTSRSRNINEGAA